MRGGHPDSGRDDLTRARPLTSEVPRSGSPQPWAPFVTVFGLRWPVELRAKVWPSLMGRTAQRRGHLSSRPPDFCLIRRFSDSPVGTNLRVRTFQLAHDAVFLVRALSFVWFQMIHLFFWSSLLFVRHDAWGTSSESHRAWWTVQGAPTLGQWLPECLLQQRPLRSPSID